MNTLTVTSPRQRLTDEERGRIESWIYAHDEQFAARAVSDGEAAMLARLELRLPISRQRMTAVAGRLRRNHLVDWRGCPRAFRPCWQGYTPRTWRRLTAAIDDARASYNDMTPAQVAEDLRAGGQPFAVRAVAEAMAFRGLIDGEDLL
ncbi:MAG: hypothetical protein GX591_14145 [Planctomycetes bacterium]|nr:hypothetical protein [Planctomycetota bacterium]